MTQSDWIFDGVDLNQERDAPRLTGQIKRIYALMKDGHKRTLDCIALATGAPHASVSAQLRNLRKDRFGAHTVERNHLGGGLYEYSLIVNE